MPNRTSVMYRVPNSTTAKKSAQQNPVILWPCQLNSTDVNYRNVEEGSM